MPTKPKKPPAETIVALSRGMETLLAAEEVLRRAEKRDRDNKSYQVPLGPEDKAALRLAGLRADDPPQIRRLFGRLRAERTLAAAAGSSAQYEQAQADAAAATEALKEADDLRRKIAQAQARLGTLEENHRAAVGRVEAMQSARTRLRDPKQLPLFLGGRVEQFQNELPYVDDAKRAEMAAACDAVLDVYVELVTDHGEDWLDKLIVQEAAV
jgi:hypothetical protein